MRPAICASLLAVSLTSCTATKTEVVAAKTVPTVATAVATRSDLASKLTLTGEFEPYQEVDVMAKVSGYLREIKVDIGDRVRAGQLLATLESPEMEDDLTRAQASIEEADSGLAAARDELTRSQAAHDIAHLSYNRILDVSKKEPGLVPQQEVDEAHSRDLVSEAQIASAKSKIAMSEQHSRVARAEQSRFKTLQRYTTITAPFDGVVTKRYGNVGALIQAGTSSQTQAMPLVRLSQNNLLRLTLPVPESSVAGIRLGQAVDVRVPSMNRNFSGQVKRFAGKLAMSTRTMDTEVEVPNPNLLLLPGIYAEVDLQMQKHDHALTVPPSAIEGSGTPSPKVYVVGADHAIHIVAVTTALEDSQRVEILTGLRDGDEVVVSRRSGLVEGEQVQAKPAN